MRRLVLFAAALAALPALAQTSTTVTTQSQATPPPPPPSTTVTTTQQPPPPSTQVVVNPNEPTTTTTSADVSSVQTASSGRSTVAIIATDAVYGGLAGAVIGGGITLIDQGNHWQRNLMVGAGIGILTGALIGVYDASTQNQSSTTVRRAEADPNPAASTSGPAFAALSGRF